MIHMGILYMYLPWCLSVYMYTHGYIYLPWCLGVYMYTHGYIYLPWCLGVYMYTHGYTYIPTMVFGCIYVYTWVYVYTYHGVWVYTVYDRIHARACISLSLLFGPASIRARRLYEPRRLLDANADARVTKF